MLPSPGKLNPDGFLQEGEAQLMMGRMLPMLQVSFEIFIVVFDVQYVCMCMFVHCVCVHRSKFGTSHMKYLFCFSSH